ncbi:MAG: amidohydrolase family protein [Vicinamibacterales bacterium]
MTTSPESPASRVLRSALPAFVSVLIAACGPRQAPADLVVTNGRVYTGVGSPMQEAVAVRGGEIVAVGSAEAMADLQGPDTTVVDAAGASVLPGFNDSHVHFLSGSQGLAELDLSDARTLDDIQRAIREFADAHPTAAWIRGRGWEYTPFPGGLPTRQLLDAALPDRPAALVCFDGHSTWVNSKALDAAGVTRDTADPPNGAITREASGAPAGLLKESAQDLVRRVLPRPTMGERLAALKEGVAHAHALGVTSVQNANGNEDELAVWEEARKAGALPLRVYLALSVSPGFSDADADRFDAIRARVQPDDRFRLGAAKLLVDGVIETNTAAMLAPYVNDPASTGRANYSQDELDRIVATLDRRGWQIFTHAIGDRGVRMVLDAYEKAATANPAPARGRRHRIEHIETIDWADVPRFGALGVIASMQPPHTSLMNEPHPVDHWVTNVGPERQARGWPWKSIAEAGGHLAFGSDWPVVSIDPLAGIWTGLGRIGFLDVPNQRLTVGQMIDGYTSGAAYASFDEARKGRLAEGQLADIVVLTRDIFAKPPESADDVRVAVTIFDGTVVYRR